MDFLLPFYSITGRPARNQPQILRSFIFFFLLFSEGLAKPSLTLWVRRLKHDHVLASLICYATDSLPPLSSYIDFMDRLWSDLYARDKLLPASWNTKKPDTPKGKKQKAQEAEPKITESIKKRLMNGMDIPFNFEGRLQRFFYHATILPSMESGLISRQHLTVSGDGTAVHTHACPRGHHRDGHRKACGIPPDASWGWNSDLEKYYFGYTLFQLSCYNTELRTDIPLLLRFTSARRHDSVNFLVAFHKLEKHMPAVSIENMCLDSAMNNYPAYQIHKNRGIRAFIDRNKKCGRPKTIPDTITIDKYGTPLCQEKRRMKPNGYDKSSVYLMWCCPYGKEHCSKCKNSCTVSEYGRVIKTKEHYSFMATMIGICILLDACYKQHMQTAA